MPPTETITATNETDLLREQIKRLDALLASSTLTIQVSDGGIDSPQTLTLERLLVVPRDEVFCTLNRLRSALALREEQGW